MVGNHCKELNVISKVLELYILTTNSSEMELEKITSNVTQRLECLFAYQYFPVCFSLAPVIHVLAMKQYTVLLVGNT